MGAPSFEQIPQQAQQSIRSFQDAVRELPKSQRREVVEYVEHNTDTKGFAHDGIDFLMDYPGQCLSILSFAAVGAVWIFRDKIKQLLGVQRKVK